MGLFKKKRSSGVIDYSLMQKRGLIKEAAVPAVPKASNDGIVDFSAYGSSSPRTNSPSYGSSDDFLSSLANVGNSNSGHGSVMDSLREARQKNLANPELSEMKIKLEDAEYRIRMLENRIRELEQRLGNQ